MHEEERQFREICERMAAEHADVVPGQMMSSPGLACNGKYFTFYWAQRRQMVFRLGRDFDPKAHGVENYSLLNPFKTKPPLVDWFCIPFAEGHWEEMAGQALERMRATPQKRKRS